MIAAYFSPPLAHNVLFSGQSLTAHTIAAGQNGGRGGRADLSLILLSSVMWGAFAPGTKFPVASPVGERRVSRLGLRDPRDTRFPSPARIRGARGEGRAVRVRKEGKWEDTRCTPRSIAGLARCRRRA